MTTSSIEKIKQATTDEEATEIFNDIKKTERLIVLSLISMLKTKFLKEEVPDWASFENYEKEECLRIYLELENIFKEHYVDYKDD